MSATLGGLIKDYRLQKNISQLEIAFAMGWKEPSRLSRIEQGRVGNPSREFLDKLIAIMKLDEEEKNHLLYAGSYLPTDEEIKKIRQEVKTHIEEWQYPAVLYDFAWYVIDENHHASQIFNYTLNDKNRERKNLVHVFERIFDPDFRQNRFYKGKELIEWRQYLLLAIMQFMQKQRNRTKECWYTELIKKLMNNSLFRELWQKAQVAPHSVVTTDFLEETDVNPLDHRKRLRLYDFTAPWLSNLRFDIEYHVPADMETMRYFKK